MNTQAKIGWVLFTSGFLGATAASMPRVPLWSVFIPSLLLSVGGALAARFARTTTEKASARAGTGSLDLKPFLETMISELDRIRPLLLEQKAKESIAAVEELQFKHIADFVADRKRYLQHYGPVTFAHFFGAFAQGERNINRVWSAVVDNHFGEAAASLETAKYCFEKAVDIIENEAAD